MNYCGQRGLHGEHVGEARLSKMRPGLGDSRWGGSLCNVEKIGKVYGNEMVHLITDDGMAE